MQIDVQRSMPVDDGSVHEQGSLPAEVRGPRSLYRRGARCLGETPFWATSALLHLLLLLLFLGVVMEPAPAEKKETLLRSQRSGNIDEDGSWDPIGEWGAVGGRVYATALGAMTLEVYYRVARIQAANPRQKQRLRK